MSAYSVISGSVYYSDNNILWFICRDDERSPNMVEPDDSHIMVWCDYNAMRYVIENVRNDWSAIAPLLQSLSCKQPPEFRGHRDHGIGFTSEADAMTVRLMMG